MKELGNLAIVCAQRKDVLLTISDGIVNVFVGSGPDRATLTADWRKDEKVHQMVLELNHGKYRLESESDSAVALEAYICYEEMVENIINVTRDEFALILSRDSMIKWVKERVEKGINWNYEVDERTEDEVQELDDSDAPILIRMQNKDDENEFYDIIAEKHIIKIQ